MIKDKKKNLFLKRLLPTVIIVVCLLMGVGYTTVNYVSLDIKGEVVAMEQDGIIITSMEYNGGNNSVEDNNSLKVINETVIYSDIELSKTDSSSNVSFKITIYNGTDYVYYFREALFDEEFYDNQNIVFSFFGLSSNDTILVPGEEISFYMYFMYKPGVNISSASNTLCAYVNFDFELAPILKATSSSDVSTFRNTNYKSKIKTLSFETGIGIPTDAVDYWDISERQNGEIMAYLSSDYDDSTYYTLHIQSNCSKIFGNVNMDYWFSGLEYLDVVYGIEKLDTSLTTGMRYMFSSTGYNSTVFELDVSGFNTSNVTNMKGMFYNTGYNSKNLNLNVSGFDTADVTDMSYMFYNAGYYSSVYELDVTNFVTSKVTDMNNMFKGAGYRNTNFTLDVTGFDTSKVTNMSSMFYGTGALSTVFTLDVSGFDTSNVTDMSHMFRDAGYYSQVLTLDVSNFDTSKVTDMSYMFRSVGDRCTIFNLTLGEFDTSNVIKITDMFYSMANYSTNLNFSITIRNPNITVYSGAFNDLATLSGTKVVVNYTTSTSTIIDKIIATKSSNGNVVKGVNVDGDVFRIDMGNPGVGTGIYQYDVGMTWTDWVNSSYNTAEVVIVDNRLWYRSVDLLIEIYEYDEDGNLSYVYASEVIDPNKKYIFSYFV